MFVFKTFMHINYVLIQECTSLMTFSIKLTSCHEKKKSVLKKGVQNEILKNAGCCVQKKRKFQEMVSSGDVNHKTTS